MADINSLINTIRTGVYGSDIREAIADALAVLAIKSVSGAGWTTDQINLLNDILSSLAYVGTSGQDKVAALITSLKTTKPPVIPDDPTPEEPDEFNVPDVAETNLVSPFAYGSRNINFVNADGTTFPGRLLYKITNGVIYLRSNDTGKYTFTSGAATLRIAPAGGSGTTYSLTTSVTNGVLKIDGVKNYVASASAAYTISLEVSGLTEVTTPAPTPSEKITKTSQHIADATGSVLTVPMSDIPNGYNKITLTNEQMSGAYSDPSKIVLTKTNDWRVTELYTYGRGAVVNWMASPDSTQTVQMSGTNLIVSGLSDTIGGIVYQVKCVAVGANSAFTIEYETV